MPITAMKHQLQSLKRFKKSPIMFDMSDPGTGKTFVEIADFAARRNKKGGKAIVFAPKSLLTAAWKNDFLKFEPGMYVSCAYAHNRQQAFDLDADVYVVNHDAVDTVLKQPKKWLDKIDTLIVDESGAYKHHTSQRSKAIRKLSQRFEFRRLMNGTPMPNTVLDLWHQMLILDGGERLGNSFYAFRNAACTPVQVGREAHMLNWEDRPGIETIVTDLIKDVMVRHRFEDCVDIPANHRYAIEIELSAKHMKLYKELEGLSLLEHKGKVITAVNGAVLYSKLLQMSSGAVYSSPDTYSLMDSDRYEMTLDLVEARQHSVVFYLWKHQLEEMVKIAKKRKISYAVWDSSKPELEKEFQDGKYQVMFAHPQSAGHGLTLTRATATIWPSPTHNLEWFLQGFKRIHRIGQQQKTETIVLVAKGTVDERVFNDILNAKDARQKDFLDLATELSRAA